eukprot:SAG31_NODE_443_length_15645_cov_51.693169_7_plen_113_part_00
MTAELACSYAALILHDDEQEVTKDKLDTLIAAAGLSSKVESYWPALFATALKGAGIEKLLLTPGGGGGGGSGGSGGGDSGGAEPEPEPEPEEEPEEEIDMADGVDMFGGDDY